MSILALAGVSLLLLGLVLYILGKKLGYKTAAIVVIAILALELVYVIVRNQVGVYETPEKAFAAAHSGLEAREVVYGLDTALVLGQEGDQVVFTVLDRSEQGYRIVSADQTAQQPLSLPGGAKGTVIHKEGALDYYVEVLFPDGAEHSLTDSCGSAFRKGALPGPESRYYAVLQELPEDYRPVIDGAEANG